MRRLAGLLATAIVAGAPLLMDGAGSAAQADPICQSFTFYSSKVGTIVMPPLCVPYKNATLCSNENINFNNDPALVWHLCGPAPVVTEPLPS